MDELPRVGRRGPGRLAEAGAAAALALGLAVVLVLTGSPRPSAGVTSQPSAAPTPAPSTSPSLAAPVVVNGTPVPWQDVAADGTVEVHLYFGWTSTCPHCAKARPFIAQLAREWPWLRVHSYQLDGDPNAPNVEFIAGLASGLGGQLSGVPIFLFGGQMEAGFDEATTTGAMLRAELAAYHDNAVAALQPGSPGASGGTSHPVPSPGVQPIALPFLGMVDVGSLSLPVVTVVLASLDAVNPCALSVLLFLLSLLVGSRSRGRMVAIGGTFVLVSGLAYFVFMAAWLNLFLLTGGLRIVTLLAGVAALVAATINIKDFVWFRRGVSLVIPESAKPRIFGRMIDFTERTQFSALFGGTILVAIAANAYEALCTGGFPVVFTRILTLHGLPVAEYYLWLALYSLVYVAPLFAIVVGFAWTLGRHTVTITEARRLKLLSGLLMFGLGVLLVVAPERLGDLGASLVVFGAGIAVWLIAVVVDRRRARNVAAAPVAPTAARSHAVPSTRGAAPPNIRHRPGHGPRGPRSHASSGGR